MRGWLDAFGLLALKLPPRSSDLNPIERLQGWMARRVCGVAQKREDREELLEFAMKRWSEIDQDRLKTLASSLENRHLSAIKAKGRRADC